MIIKPLPISSDQKKTERQDAFIECIPVGYESRKHIGQIADDAKLTADELWNLIDMTLRQNSAVILWDKRMYVFIPKDTADLMNFLEKEGVQALIAPFNQWRRERINWHF